MSLSQALNQFAQNLGRYQWLFPLLDGFAMTTDFSKMDMQTTRAVGHLSERLLNIFTRCLFRSATPLLVL